MKKVMFTILMIFTFMAVMPAMALACDDPSDSSCEDIWVGGENDQYQWQDFNKSGLVNGGVFENSGAQCVNNWGAITGSGYGEYSSNTQQAEGMDLTNGILGGEVFNRHQAVQNAEMELFGNDANAWISGDNEFNSKTAVYGNEIPPCGNELMMGSENSGRLDMDASLCVYGGTAKYSSEVITETGHLQELDLPGGTGFTSSYSGQRGFVELNGND